MSLLNIAVAVGILENLDEKRSKLLNLVKIKDLIFN